MAWWGIAVIVLLFTLAPAVVGFRVGEQRNLSIGLALGLLLSWIGVLILYLLPYRGRKCPECAEHIRPDAVACRYCGTRLT